MFNKHCVSGFLMLALVLPISCVPSLAQPENNRVISGDIRLTVMPTEVDKPLAIKNLDQTINLSFREITLSEAFRALAKVGGFNVVLDESVQGTLSIDFNDVSMADALQALKSYGKLAYSSQSNDVLMVTSADSPRGKEFQRTATQVFKLKYANPAIVSTLLNNTVFATGGAGDLQVGNKATFDFKTNSVIVIGSSADMILAQEYINALDVARESKTWRLSHANALDVVSLLSSSLFNEGIPAAVVSQGAGAGGSAAGGAGSVPASIRVRAENMLDGTGSGSKDNSSGSSTDSTAKVVNNVTVRGLQKQDLMLSLSAQGPLLVPDTRLNTITLLGTAEQIAMAEEMIRVFDRRAPQLTIEAVLIEVTDEGMREMGFNLGGNKRRLTVGSNNTQNATAPLINNPFSNNIGLPTSLNNPLENLFQYSTRSANMRSDILYQLNMLVREQKAKVLANPTAVTLHDKETLISIVDEFIRAVTSTTDTGQGGAGTTVFESNIGEAGIVLNILPKVGADGNITLRVRPSISTIREVTEDSVGNLITLLNRREVIAQSATLRDGESFVLGGLIQDNDTSDVSKLPMLADLPIIGALARSSSRNKKRSEIVIVLTPHIMQESAESTPPDRPATYNQPISKSGDAQIQPVSDITPSGNTGKYIPGLQPVNVIDNSTTPSDNSRSALPQGYESVHDKLFKTTGPVSMMSKAESVEEQKEALLKKFKNWTDVKPGRQKKAGKKLPKDMDSVLK